MKVVLAAFGILIGSVLVGSISDQVAQKREARYVEEMMAILEQNQQRFESYSVLARRFAWSDRLLATSTSIDLFDQVRAEESRELFERLKILNEIGGTVDIREGYQWRDSQRRGQFFNAFNKNKNLVDTVAELRESGRVLLACLSEQPVG